MSDAERKPTGAGEGPPLRPEALRRLRRSLLALDPREDFRSYLIAAALRFMERTGARHFGIELRFADAARDVTLLVGADGASEYAARAIDPWDRTLDLEAPPPAPPRGRFFLESLNRLAAEAGMRPSRVLSAPLRARGRTLAVVEVDGADPELLPDGPGLESFLTEVVPGFELALAYERLRHERLEARLLQEVGEQLGRTLDLRELLNTILELLRQVVPYDAAVIYLLGEDGLNVVHQSLRGYGEGKEEMVRLKVGQGIVGSAAREGRAEIVGDVRSDPRYYDARPATRSEMVAPLNSGGRVIGVFNVESDRIGAYTSHDLDLLESFAAQAAVALERARLLEREAEQRRLEQELRIARRIQRYFLPRLPERLRRLGLDGRTLPNEEVSGDYYDFLERKDGTVAVAVADVSGKGIPAALIMSSLRAAFRLEAAQRSHPSVLCRDLNNFLHGSLRETEFVTGVFGFLDPADHRFRYTNAGHNPPLLLRRDGEVEWLETGGMILGAFPNRDYEETEVEVGEGDLLVLYTDGVTEALSPAGEEFGTERLVATVREHAGRPPHQAIAALIGSVRVFAAGRLPDDLTVVMINGSGEEAR